MSPDIRTVAGFTLPEVMISALVLIVGVLGVATLTDAANRLSVTADQRSAATAIARHLSEAARQLTTPQLVNGELQRALQAGVPELADGTPADGRWTVRRVGTDYVISAVTCTVDDAADGYAAPSYRDETYCTQPAPTTPADLQPDDHRRVELTVSTGRHTVVRQVVNVPSGQASSLPLIADLRMRQGATPCNTSCAAITSAQQTTAVFDATTINNPAAVEWLVDGRAAAGCPPASVGCTGGDNAWAFTWNLGTPTLSGGLCVAGSYVFDGVYQVGVEGIDRSGATGGRASLSVSVDRCAGGTPPPGLNATGRDADGPVDVEWQRNPEGDLAGYRVYRVANGTRTPACPADVSAGQLIPLDAPTECVDAKAPRYTGTLQYEVYPLDRDAAGTLRQGSPAQIAANTGNRAPNRPVALTALRQGGSVTLTWSMPAIQDLDAGDSIHSFRIYRRDGTVAGAPALGDRIDRNTAVALCAAGTCRWSAPAEAQATYWVTAVDTHLRESAPTSGSTT